MHYREGVWGRQETEQWVASDRSARDNRGMEDPVHNDESERAFRGWRLLGIIMSAVVVLAVISAAVDWIVLGPLAGRAF